MRADGRHARHRLVSCCEYRCPSVGQAQPPGSRLPPIDKQKGASLPYALARRLVSKFWRTQVRSFAATSNLTRFLCLTQCCCTAISGRVCQEGASSSRGYGGPNESTAQEGEGEEGAFWRTESQGLCTCSARTGGETGRALARCMHNCLTLKGNC